MTRRERDEKMRQRIRQISRFTRDKECHTCNQSGVDENPACSEHGSWDMPIDDALDTIDSVNNTNIFTRPPNADEFVIWSLCQNPGSNMSHNISK